MEEDLLAFQKIHHPSDLSKGRKRSTDTITEGEARRIERIGAKAEGMEMDRNHLG